MDTLALTDYAERYLVDRLSTVDGVAQIQLGGAHRITRCGCGFDRTALSRARPDHRDVESALRARNVDIPPAGWNRRRRDFTLQLDRSFGSHGRLRNNSRSARVATAT
jgi:multidrug efflux pump